MSLTRTQIEDLVDSLPPRKVGGVGVVTLPPNAAERVRAELAAATDPVRRAEIAAVLADLERGA